MTYSGTRPAGANPALRKRKIKTAKPKTPQPQIKVKQKMNYISLGIAAAVGVAGITIVGGSWYTIDQRERGVLLRNGKLISVEQPGLGFKLPLVDDVKRISTETMLSRYEKLSIYSRDQQPADVNVSVGWRLNEAQVSELYTQYGSLAGVRDRVITPKVLEELKNVFGQYNAVTAIQERQRLNADLKAAIIRAAVGPFIIETVQIENIDFSDAYEKSIEQRMLAEVEVQKLKQNAEREMVQAQITVTQAKAKADAVRAAAQAEADAIRLRGDAEAAAIATRGKALRENPGLVDLEAIKAWDGKLPVTMVPGSAVPFIGVK